MYDVSFGGRRAFCRTDYADLGKSPKKSHKNYRNYRATFFVSDGITSYIGYAEYAYPVDTYLLPQREEPESFEDLLKKVKAKICATKDTEKN